MLFGNKEIELKDLFNTELYTREVRPIERIIDGVVVQRKRHIFHPVRKPEPIIVAKSQKKVKRVQNLQCLIKQLKVNNQLYNTIACLLAFSIV